MIYASVCSGVEAASLAWMPLGWKAAWFSEIDPFPCEVLKQRFPDVPNLGDMTKIKGEEYRGTVDLLVGGTPCQGFSVAGKQGGLNDPRSGLAMSYCRLLETMRPRWFVWENVPGVFSTNQGDDFRAFLGKIDEIGYSVAWRVLDAQYVRVDGFPRAVPQRRRRVFVVGHLGADWRYPASVLFEPEILYRNTPPRRTEGKSITGDSAVCSGTAGRFWDESGVNPTLNQCSQNSGTIGASNQELFSQDANGIVMCVESGQTCATVNIEHSPSLTCNHDHPYVGVFNSHAGGSARSISYSEDCSFTLGTEHDCSPTIAAKAGTGGGNLPIVQSFAIAENIIGRKPENGGNGNGFSEELAYTQNTCGIMGIANNSKLRYLLPVECERLMGFPDNWTRISWRGKPEEECPDSHRYKACGNSMCVNVMRWIGMRIEQIERKMKNDRNKKKKSYTACV